MGLRPEGAGQRDAEGERPERAPAQAPWRVCSPTPFPPLPGPLCPSAARTPTVHSEPFSCSGPSLHPHPSLTGGLPQTPCLARFLLVSQDCA